MALRRYGVNLIVTQYFFPKNSWLLTNKQFYFKLKNFSSMSVVWSRKKGEDFRKVKYLNIFLNILMISVGFRPLRFYKIFDSWDLKFLKISKIWKIHKNSKKLFLRLPEWDFFCLVMRAVFFGLIIHPSARFPMLPYSPLLWSMHLCTKPPYFSRQKIFFVYRCTLAGFVQCCMHLYT